LELHKLAQHDTLTCLIFTFPRTLSAAFGPESHASVTTQNQHFNGTTLILQHKKFL